MGNYPQVTASLLWGQAEENEPVLTAGHHAASWL